MIAAILLNKYVYLVISYYKINSFRKLDKAFICNMWHGLGHFVFKVLYTRRYRPLHRLIFCSCRGIQPSTKNFFGKKKNRIHNKHDGLGEG